MRILLNPPYLLFYPDRDNEYVPDRLGNLTLLVRSDLEQIGDMAPDIYMRIIQPADRAAHLISDDASLWSEAPLELMVVGIASDVNKKMDVVQPTRGGRGN